MAEINIGHLIAPVGDPRVAEFWDNTDRVNALAERSNGFVWRLKGDAGDARNFKLMDFDDAAINLSVWRDFKTFNFFVFNTLHKHFMKRGPEWFKPATRPIFAMWWVENGHQPSLQEAGERLRYLHENGESDHVFGWNYARKHYAVQGAG